MSSPLPYCRTNQTSSDVGMIGMITASARHHRPCRQRNGTKPKFFNDFSRACMRVRARERPIRVCCRQLGNIGRDPPCLVFAEQLGADYR
jgi:hypothetical protein